MACTVSSQSIVDCLASEHMAVRQESLSLLCLYSQTQRSRHMAIEDLNVQMYDIAPCFHQATFSRIKMKNENLRLLTLANKLFFFWGALLKMNLIKLSPCWVPADGSKIVLVFITAILEVIQ